VTVAYICLVQLKITSPKTFIIESNLKTEENENYFSSNRMPESYKELAEYNLSHFQEISLRMS
jgi:hypothetical protein